MGYTRRMKLRKNMPSTSDRTSDQVGIGMVIKFQMHQDSIQKKKKRGYDEKLDDECY